MWICAKYSRCPAIATRNLQCELAIAALIASAALALADDRLDLGGDRFAELGVLVGVEMDAIDALETITLPASRKSTPTASA